MFNKKYDLMFIFSIIFIAVFGLFLLNDFLKKNDLNEYLDVVKNTMAGMIPQEDVGEFEKMYASFVQNVDDEKVQPEQLKELAEKIVILRQEKERITADEVRRILPVPEAEDRVRVVKPVKPVDQVENFEWQKLARNFEKSLQRGDSIRILNLKHLKLKNEIDAKLKTYTEVSKEMKINHDQISHELEMIKKGSDEEELTGHLKSEMKDILSDNEQLRQNIIALEEIERTIKQERKKLLEELEKIESSRVIE